MSLYILWEVTRSCLPSRISFKRQFPKTLHSVSKKCILIHLVDYSTNIFGRPTMYQALCQTLGSQQWTWDGSWSILPCVSPKPVFPCKWLTRTLSKPRTSCLRWMIGILHTLSEPFDSMQKDRKCPQIFGKLFIALMNLILHILNSPQGKTAKILCVNRMEIHPESANYCMLL